MNRRRFLKYAGAATAVVGASALVLDCLGGRPRSVVPVITALAGLSVIVGVPITIWQVKAAKKALQAQILVKLIDEWRSREIYEAVSYVHKLRTEWKSSSVADWERLAKEWVQQHLGKSMDSPDKEEQRLAWEWLWRRSASQFLAKMGLMAMSGYMPLKDFFWVVPEAGRLLAVLMPIDDAIVDHWTHVEQERIADWDRPFRKLEFKELLEQYEKWYKKHGSKLV